jgi:hypothetical protein
MAIKTNDLIEHKICQLYIDGYGNSELCKLFNLASATVAKILDRNNVARYGGKKPYHNKYDINFFSSYSDAACYWAGFIYADGCITDQYGSHKVVIGLQNRDEEHLLKFVNTINFTGKLYSDNYNNAKIISICGKWWVKDLADNFNIIPRKSLIIEFPHQVPTDKLHHFIRGIFDGDGCITYTKNKKGAISLVGSYSTITNIVDIFYDLVGARIKSDNERAAIIPHHGVYLTRYVNCPAKKILDWLYNGSAPNTRLERKYLKYQEYFTNDHMYDKRQNGEEISELQELEIVEKYKSGAQLNSLKREYQIPWCRVKKILSKHGL